MVEGSENLMASLLNIHNIIKIENEKLLNNGGI